MPIEDDLSVSLPEPPPPNPARREAAIDAALRRFDGSDEAPTASDRPRAPPPSWWARLRQPQFGVAMSAVILAAIGLSVALIAIRDGSPGVVQQPAAPPVSGAQQHAGSTRENAPLNAQPAPSPSLPPAPAPLAAPPSLANPADRPRGDEVQVQENNDSKMADASPPLAYAPPPPPPPPPPAAPVVAESAAREEAVGALVTGTRKASQERGASKVSRSSNTAAAKQSLADETENSAYQAFVTRLQAAVRTNDRGSVLKLISYPLRVNSNGGSRSYASPRSVERDFDRIFTPAVRQAILKQRPDQLFTRDQGAMIGDGEVWFDNSCLNSECTALGPVRIKAVNR